MIKESTIDAVVICSPTDTHADYVEMAAYAEPALSTVRVNRYNMGSKAMELIFEKINPQTDEASSISAYINTGFELVIRQSTR